MANGRRPLWACSLVVRIRQQVRFLEAPRVTARATVAESARASVDGTPTAMVFTLQSGSLNWRHRFGRSSVFRILYSVLARHFGLGGGSVGSVFPILYSVLTAPFWVQFRIPYCVSSAFIQPAQELAIRNHEPGGRLKRPDGSSPVGSRDPLYREKMSRLRV